MGHRFVALLALFLVACGSAQQPAFFGVTMPTSTPASASVAMMDAERLQATAEARMFEAQRQAAEATAAVAQVTANARATVDAMSYRATATAEQLAMLQEQDAATAQAGQATRDAESTRQAEAFNVRATDDAYNMAQAERSAAATREARQQARSEARAIGFAVFLGLVGVALAIVAVRGLELLIRARAMAYFMRDSMAGPITLVDGNLQYAPRILAPAIDGELSEPAQIPRLIQLTSNGQEQPPIEVGPDRNPERTNQALVRWLLREARDYLDETGGRRDVIPGHRHLSLSADQWTRAVGILKANRVAYAIPRSGTYFYDGWDVDTALSNLGRLDFSPARLESVP